jgi:hypothetical protein
MEGIELIPAYKFRHFIKAEQKQCAKDEVDLWLLVVEDLDSGDQRIAYDHDDQRYAWEDFRVPECIRNGIRDFHKAKKSRRGFLNKVELFVKEIQELSV